MSYPEILLAVTGLVILGATARAYMVSRDPLHPMVFLSPMLAYVFVVRPVVLLRAEALQRYFTTPQLTFVLLVKLLAITAFCGGCLWGLWQLRRQPRQAPALAITPLGSQWIFLLACLFGTLSVMAFIAMLVHQGGFFQAYSTPYSGAAWSYTGYLLEAPYLSVAAVGLLAISCQSRAWQPLAIPLSLLFASPLLVQGILGARRGPTFVGLAAVWLAWYVYTRRRPSLLKTVAGVTALGLLMLALVVFRPNIYLGSKFDVDPQSLTQQLFSPVDAGPGEDFIDSSGMILTAARYGRYNWGTRLLVTYLVRPIPRQIWPDKYADCGFAWMDSKVQRFGYSDIEWQNAAGFIPTVGMALSFDASFFMDFSWGGLAGCWLAGMFFAYLWRKERQSQGVWHLLSLASLSLSVYFPTQDFSAFFYRWLFVCVPAVVLWAWLVRPHLAIESAPRRELDPRRTEPGAGLLPAADDDVYPDDINLRRRPLFHGPPRSRPFRSS